MAFGQDAVEQLSRELLGGYNLNTRLLALLGVGPLDGRRQEAAVAMIQELSGVFRNLMVSLFMLNSPLAATYNLNTGSVTCAPWPTNTAKHLRRQILEEEKTAPVALSNYDLYYVQHYTRCQFT
jgi:hypothetical protein